MPRSPRTLLAWAGACAGAFVAVLLGAYFTGPGRWLDGAALEGFMRVQRPLVRSITEPVAHLVDPLPYGLLGGSLVAVALARGARARAAAVAGLLAATGISSQVLKELLAHPRYHDFLGYAQILPDAFPSGHATAAMSLALGAVLVVPPAWRAQTAAAGGAFALAIAYSILALGWHFPSDVAGGLLLATGWALVALAAVRAREARAGDPAHGAGEEPARPARAVAAPLVAVAALAAGSALALTAAYARELAGYAERHTAAVAVAAALSAVTIALVGALTAATRR
jgi:membrane-associated phospholipid phosphatase